MENTHSLEAATEIDSSDESGILDILQLIASNLRLLLVGPLLAGIVALGITFLITPSFTATVRVMPPPQQSQGAAAAMLQSLGTLGAVAGGSGGLKNPGDLYVGLLKSRSVQDAMIDKFKLMDRYDYKYKDSTRKELTKRTTILNGKDSIIVVDIEDDDPEFAAQMANGYSQELGNLLSRLSITEAQMRRSFFEKQLATTKSNLDKSEIALKASGGVSVSALKLNPGFSVGTTAQIKGQMTSLEIKLVSMKGYMSETAPEYKQVITELSALRGQLSKIEKEEATPNAADSDYLDKYRDYKYYDTLYELLIRQFESAKLDESREGNVMQIVDTAVIPERKSKPKRGLIAALVGIVVGFLLLMFIFVRRSFFEAQQNPNSAGKLLLLKQTIRQSFTRNKNAGT
jgi:tyrosine-protein kinase Etk/Wzc